MTQTSTKRRNIIIASIVIVVLVISSICALIEFNQLTTTRINLSLSTNQTNVIQGSNSQIQVEVTSIGKAENITLSSNVGLNSINCTFEPTTGKSNFTSTLTMNVPDSTPTGNYPVTIIASSDGQAVNASSVLSVLSANVTVSGKAASGNAQIYNNSGYLHLVVGVSSLIGIQFTDIQTGTKTSFSFSFTPPLSSTNAIGVYSVTLMNEHTYNVTISYYWGPSFSNVSQFTDDISNFTVYAPDGETAISKDFP
jgi:hypothetical protein